MNVIEKVMLESRVRLAEAAACGWQTVATEQGRQMQILKKQLLEKDQEISTLQAGVTELTTKLVIHTHCKCHAAPQDLKDALISLQAAEIQILRQLVESSVTLNSNVPA